jgi:hypothetical protein
VSPTAAYKEWLTQLLFVVAVQFSTSSLLSKNIKIKIHRTVIFPVVLCGCKTWSFTLREDHWLRVFGSRVLTRIFGPKRDEITGE